MTTTPPTLLSEKQKMGLFGAVSIGIAAMIGGGIFPVLAESVRVAGSAVFLAFIVSGICVLVTSYSYSKLTLHYDTEGGTVSFVHLLLKNLYVSSTINILLLFTYILMTAAYARSFGLYAHALFPSVDKNLMIYAGLIFSIVLPIIIDIVSSKAVSWVESILVILQIAIFLVLIIAGFKMFNPQNVAPSTWPSVFPIIAGGMLLFLSYVGFEFIANTKKDLKNPEKNIPRAFYISVIVVIVIYSVLSFVTMGDLDASMMGHSHHLLATAGQVLLGNFGFFIIVIAALLSMFSSNTSTIYACVKMFNMISSYKEVPHFFQFTYKEVHLLTLGIIGGLSIILGFFGDMASLINVVTSALLLLYTVVNFSCFLNAKEINSNRWIGLFATLVTFFAGVILIMHIVKSHPQDILPLIYLVAISAIFGVGYQIYLKFKTPTNL